MSHAPHTTREAWSNWSGLETWTPAESREPSSLAAVQAAVVEAAERGQTVRAIGSRHSFTDAAASSGIQLTLDRLSRLVDLDVGSGLVTVEAGMPLHRLNTLLAEHGLALPNLGDIDTQTIAGAISTGTHGTGIGLTGLAGQVAGLGLVGADGQAFICSAHEQPDLFAAARVSLGALGIVTHVSLQTVPAFRLRAVERPAPLDEVLENLDELVEGHDHFEFYWFPHTSSTSTKRNDRVPDEVAAQPVPRWRSLLEDEVMANVVFEGTNRLVARVPKLVPRINAIAARGLPTREYVDASYRVFVSPRRVRFSESEYAVPRAAIPQVVKELRRWVDAHDVRIPFPVEVRFAASDDMWLSTAADRVSGYVAIHQYHRMQHDEYFTAFEAITADVGGRPHWGKLHRLGAAELSGLYPRFDDFVALRDRLDPDRRFANAYTARVFGD